MLDIGSIVCAKYEIIQMIGRGGMSAVYKARDYSTGQIYAIKDVERSGRENRNIVEQSLATEGNMLKRLNNPHLPRIYDIIEDTDSFMLVMDFVDGESLDKVVQRTGPLPEANIYYWCMQICEVFHYLHNQPQPIVYRDMKPANIMLQPNGNIMMIDFGTARTQKVGQVLQSDTVCIGTEGFAAPEQFGGISQSDARTDIFCLGATMYNLLTGHSPCDNPKGILPLERWNPAYAASPLNDIITKCTRNDPNERYQTAMELRNDLESASLGNFHKGRRGKSGPFGSKQRRGDWQVQKVKTAGDSGGLLGLIGNEASTYGRARQPAGNPQAQWTVSYAGANQPYPQQPIQNPQPAYPPQAAWQQPVRQPMQDNPQPAYPQNPYQNLYQNSYQNPANPRQQALYRPSSAQPDRQAPQAAYAPQPQRQAPAVPAQMPQGYYPNQAPAPTHNPSAPQPPMPPQPPAPMQPKPAPMQSKPEKAPPAPKPPKPECQKKPELVRASEQQGSSVMQKLMIIAAVIAVVLLISSIVLLAVDLSTVALFTLIFAIGAAALMVIGVIGVLKERKENQ